MSEQFIFTQRGSEEYKRVRESAIKNYSDLLVANARILAAKEGRSDIDEIHIQKSASTIVNIKHKGKTKWILGASIPLLLAISLIQIGLLFNSPLQNYIHLWILPIGVILNYLYVMYIFSDFINWSL